MQSERLIYSGNKISSQVDSVGTYRLVLKSAFVLELERTFYIPSFSKNLISVSRLIPSGFSFSFVGSTFSLIKESVVVGDGTLVDGLYRLSLHPTFDHSFLTMHKSVGTKHKFMDEKSSMLWHMLHPVPS